MPLGASEPPIWLGHAPGPWADLGAFTFFSIRVIIRLGLVSSSLVADIPPPLKSGMSLCRSSWKLLTEMKKGLPSRQLKRHLGPLDENLLHWVRPRGPAVL